MRSISVSTSIMAHGWESHPEVRRLPSAMIVNYMEVIVRTLLPGQEATEEVPFV